VSVQQHLSVVRAGKEQAAQLRVSSSSER
jgi:hypothetical protein